MPIKVWYQANYNGCNVEDENESGIKSALVEEKITDRLYTDCDDEGYCQLDADDIEDIIVEIIKAEYGADAVVEVDVDTFST